MTGGRAVTIFDGTKNAATTVVTADINAENHTYDPRILKAVPKVFMLSTPISFNIE